MNQTITYVIAHVARTEKFWAPVQGGEEFGKWVSLDDAHEFDDRASATLVIDLYGLNGEVVRAL